MYNYKKIIVLGLIVLLVPILGVYAEKKLEKNISLSILEDMGGKFLEADLSGGTSINDKFLDNMGIRILGEEIRNYLGLTGKKVDGKIYDFNLQPTNYSEKFIDDENFKQLTTWGINNEDYLTTVIITSYKDSKNNIEETTLYINFIIKENFNEINDIMYKIENIFKNFDKEVEISTCVVGTFEGQLDNIEKEDIIYEGIKKVKGKVIEKFVEDDLVSIIAYTPCINEYVFLENEKINLNIAIRYNELEKNTYLWIGTPVITISY